MTHLNHQADQESRTTESPKKPRDNHNEDIQFLKNILKNVLGEMWEILDEATLDNFIQQLEWLSIQSGECLYQQGSPGNCMHILISGRLRVLLEKGDETVILGEISDGECVGEMSLIAKQSRSASIYAIRNSMLVKITQEQFDVICQAHPMLLKEISRTIIHRMTNESQIRKKPTALKNIVLLPVSKGIDMTTFVSKIQQNLEKEGTVLLLNKNNINEHLQGIPFNTYSEDHVDNVKIGRMLDKLEMQYDYILYQGNYSDDKWTHNCIRQADKIMLISDFYDFEKTPAEKRLLDGVKKLSYVSKNLVLLHPNSDQPPVGTARHLEIREVDMHHHIRWNKPNDFQRLARFLTGKAVGLVLGGGGAKGFAHIGIINRLRELNVPIDFVGGTSVGALIGAGVAIDLDNETFYNTAKTAFVTDKPLNDRTIPLVSYYSGKRMDKILEKHFGKGDIEDQWINFFCVSSNLTKASSMIHRKGCFWKALRASMSIPGAFPPVVHGNSLLVDGGLMNNLPIDIMAKMDVGKIIAINVNAEKEYELGYDQIPTTTELLMNKFASKKKRLKVPSLMTIISKSIVLSSYEKANTVHHLADLFLNPPVGRVGILDFKKIEKVEAIGREYLDDLLAEQPDLLKKLV